jgi:signal transduction histidine kinase
MPSSFSPSSSRLDHLRRPMIVGCLAAALILVAALGGQAITAARAQRDAVEGVLRDYATLAAEQYARNVNVTFEYEWFQPMLRLAADPRTIGQPDGDADPLSHARSRATPLDPVLEVQGQRAPYRLGEMALAIFAIDAGGSVRARAVGDRAAATPPDLATLVLAHLDNHWAEDTRNAAFLLGDENRGSSPALIVYTRAEADAPYLVLGFTADAAMLQRFLANAVTVYTLLPPSLTARAGDTELVRVRVEDDTGAILFRHGPEGSPAIEAAFDLEPRLADLRVVAAIPAASAAWLVVGGLPYSRLPLTAALLALTLALAATGALLWRREQELVALREQFVAGASHELRTPLAQIRMFAETLRLQRVRSDEEQRRALEVIDREARRLSLLVENLLQFSSARRGPQPFVAESVDVRLLAAEVVAGFEPLAAARGAVIELVPNAKHTGATTLPGAADTGTDGPLHGPADTGTDGPLHVPADRDMLRQVLVNLLDNAIKYGSDGQTVRVEIDAHDDAVCVSVTDQGPGIRPEEAELIWQRFWRSPTANGITGTGIGLALVRELVELHGGSVAARSGHEGGARFEVRLPRRRP